MRPHDVSGACGHTLHGALTLPASERRASAPQPRRRQSVRDRPGELFATPSAGYSSAPFREPVPPWKCRHPAESSEGAGPENSSATPSAGCSSTPVSESAPRKTCVPRKTLDAVGPGNGSPPLGGLFLPARPGCRIPTCRPRVLTHPIRYPTASLISIGRVPIYRGAMMPRSCSSI